MNRFSIVTRRALGALLLLALAVGPLAAQRVGFSKDEFVRRRQALRERAKEGIVVLFGLDVPPEAASPRQDNDFFYLCGVEDLGAILTLNARTGETNLFLPRQSPREEMISGANLLKDEYAKGRLGLSNLYDLGYFDEYLARNARSWSVAVVTPPAWRYGRRRPERSPDLRSP